MTKNLSKEIESDKIKDQKLMTKNSANELSNTSYNTNILKTPKFNTISNNLPPPPPAFSVDIPPPPQDHQNIQSNIFKPKRKYITKKMKQKQLMQYYQQQNHFPNNQNLNFPDLNVLNLFEHTKQDFSHFQTQKIPNKLVTSTNNEMLRNIITNSNVSESNKKDKIGLGACGPLPTVNKLDEKIVMKRSCTQLKSTTFNEKRGQEKIKCVNSKNIFRKKKNKEKKNIFIEDKEEIKCGVERKSNTNKEVLPKGKDSKQQYENYGSNGDVNSVLNESDKENYQQNIGKSDDAVNADDGSSKTSICNTDMISSSQHISGEKEEEGNEFDIYSGLSLSKSQIEKIKIKNEELQKKYKKAMEKQKKEQIFEIKTACKLINESKSKHIDDFSINDSDLRFMLDLCNDNENEVIEIITTKPQLYKSLIASRLSSYTLKFKKVEVREGKKIFIILSRCKEEINDSGTNFDVCDSVSNDGDIEASSSEEIEDEIVNQNENDVDEKEIVPSTNQSDSDDVTNQLDQNTSDNIQLTTIEKIENICEQNNKVETKNENENENETKIEIIKETKKLQNECKTFSNSPKSSKNLQNTLNLNENTSQTPQTSPIKQDKDAFIPLSIPLPLPLPPPPPLFLSNYPIDKQQQRQQSVPRLRLNQALSNPLDQSDWSEARKVAYQRIDSNPNTYYYRFNRPGEKQAGGAQSREEEEMFFRRMAEVGVGENWGIFSMTIPGRVGYQCSNFYRRLLKDGRIIDPNYTVSGNKLKFKRVTRKQPTIVEQDMLIDKNERIENAHRNGTLDPTEVIPLPNTNTIKPLHVNALNNKTKIKRGRPPKPQNELKKKDKSKRKLRKANSYVEHYHLPNSNESNSIQADSSDEDESLEMISEIFRRQSRSFIDPITKSCVEQPTISPYGHVMGYKTQTRILRQNPINTCPFTKRSLKRRQLVKLCEENFKQYRKLILNV